MADETLTTDTEVEEEEDAAEAAPAAASAATADEKASMEPPAPAGTETGRDSLLPRLSRPGKVFSNGFKLPGFSGYTDLPGKVCVDCGFNAMKFSKQCPKCGGELVPEGSITS